MAEKKNNSFRFQLVAKRKKSPLEWWVMDGRKKEQLLPVLTPGQHKKSPLKWWVMDGRKEEQLLPVSAPGQAKEVPIGMVVHGWHRYPTLQKIAIKLFTMATSSTASKRNFSTMGFIHSKLRNTLATKTVEKLIFIKSNLSAFYDYPAPNNDATAALNHSTPEDTMESDDEDVVSM
jgi:hypothetical protein